jgi:hypothetical protein
MLDAMDATEVRRWMARFEAIAEADRDALRRLGPDPQTSIRLALSLIEAARDVARSNGAAERLRESDDEQVRVTWKRLRHRLAR